MHSVSRETRAAMKENPRIVYEMFCITLSVRFHAAVGALHDGMSEARWSRDNARREIRNAVLIDKVRDGLSASAPRVLAERRGQTG